MKPSLQLVQFKVHFSKTRFNRIVPSVLVICDKSASILFLGSPEDLSLCGGLCESCIFCNYSLYCTIFSSCFSETIGLCVRGQVTRRNVGDVQGHTGFMQTSCGWRRCWRTQRQVFVLLTCRTCSLHFWSIICCLKGVVFTIFCVHTKLLFVQIW